MISIQDMATFCKKKGFVYQSSEIYGGYAGFFDFGYLGVELKNNIKREWWKTFVQNREDVIGVEGSIITHPKVWRASGHTENFLDAIIQCNKCKEKFRADHLIEEKLKINLDGISERELSNLIIKHKISCPKCKGNFTEIQSFNLMFQTNVGAEKKNISYLRPETAQIQFVDLKQLVENYRLKFPFGIAQIGKAFRNEIAPRNFLFRMREFEQMEIEYMIHPDQINDCPFIKQVLNQKVNILSEDMQKKDNKHKEYTIKKALSKKIIQTEWLAYWITIQYRWYLNLGIKKENLRIREHKKNELSHYAKSCFDIEYNFPFGWKEIQGVADRQQFDIKQHMEHSRKDLTLYDERSKSRITPYIVAEPSQGVERAFLAFLYEAYENNKKRGNIVLHLNPKLAPVKIAVFPLVSNKKQITTRARKIFDLVKEELSTVYDSGSSIGRRYARTDEYGVPYTITIDYNSLKKDDITLRDRESTKQIRVKTSKLIETLHGLLLGELKFTRLGKPIN